MSNHIKENKIINSFIDMIDSPLNYNNQNIVPKLDLNNPDQESLKSVVKDQNLFSISMFCYFRFYKIANLLHVSDQDLENYIFNDQSSIPLVTQSCNLNKISEMDKQDHTADLLHKSQLNTPLYFQKKLFEKQPEQKSKTINEESPSNNYPKLLKDKNDKNNNFGSIRRVSSTSELHCLNKSMDLPSGNYPAPTNPSTENYVFNRKFSENISLNFSQKDQTDPKNNNYFQKKNPSCDNSEKIENKLDQSGITTIISSNNNDWKYENNLTKHSKYEFNEFLVLQPNSNKINVSGELQNNIMLDEKRIENLQLTINMMQNISVYESETQKNVLSSTVLQKDQTSQEKDNCLLNKPNEINFHNNVSNDASPRFEETEVYMRIEKAIQLIQKNSTWNNNQKITSVNLLKEIIALLSKKPDVQLNFSIFASLILFIILACYTQRILDVFQYQFYFPSLTKKILFQSLFYAMLLASNYHCQFILQQKSHQILEVSHSAPNPPS